MAYQTLMAVGSPSITQTAILPQTIHRRAQVSPEECMRGYVRALASSTEGTGAGMPSLPGSNFPRAAATGETRVPIVSAFDHWCWQRVQAAKLTVGEPSELFLEVSLYRHCNGGSLTGFRVGNMRAAPMSRKRGVLLTNGPQVISVLLAVAYDRWEKALVAAIAAAGDPPPKGAIFGILAEDMHEK